MRHNISVAASTTPRGYRHRKDAAARARSEIFYHHLAAVYGAPAHGMAAMVAMDARSRGPGSRMLRCTDVGGRTGEAENSPGVTTPTSPCLALCVTVWPRRRLVCFFRNSARWFLDVSLKGHILIMLLIGNLYEIQNVADVPARLFFAQGTEIVIGG